MIAVTKVTKIKEDKYSIESLPCRTCKQTTSVEIGGYALFQLNQGAGAMTVLPDVSVDVRERFMSGFCPPCWTAMFAADEDE